MRRRTGLLFTSAVVLGLLGGAGTGWAIQRQRAATPLPPLSATVGAVGTVGTRALPAAGAPTQSPDPATDDGAKLDGDLRKLLVDKPADATDTDFTEPVGWITLRDVAEYSTDSDREFVHLNHAGFRRAVHRLWDAKDGTTVDVEITQFRSTAGAVDYIGYGVGRQHDAVKIAGTSSGYAVAWPTRNTDGSYWGEGLALHGTVVVGVYVYSPTKAVDPQRIARIAEEQLGKL